MVAFARAGFFAMRGGALQTRRAGFCAGCNPIHGMQSAARDVMRCAVGWFLCGDVRRHAFDHGLKGV